MPDITYKNLIIEIANKYINTIGTDQLTRKTWYDRYMGVNLPITTYELPEYLKDDERYSKSDERLYHNFENEIITTKIGYMLGNPVDITYTDATEEEMKILNDIYISNNLDDLFPEYLKKTSIQGKSAMLLYLKDENGTLIPSMQLVNSYEYFIIKNKSLDDVEYAIRFYTVVLNKETVMKIEFYDKYNIYYFDRIQKEFNLTGSQPHGFKYVPIIEFINNAEEYADYFHSVKLIDAYNRLISDTVSEMEQFRLAYMILVNYNAELEDLEKIRRTGCFKVDSNGDVKFLTKTVDMVAIETMRKVLEKNILRFSASVNFQSEDFTGDLTTIAIQTKLKMLENKCKISERKMIKAMRDMYKCIFSYYENKGIYMDYKNLVFTFTRDVPVNMNDLASMQSTLNGLISNRTRLGLLPFVTNVETELKTMEEEAQSQFGNFDINPDLDNNTDNTDNTGDNNGDNNQ